jgi:hypothetical protein
MSETRSASCSYHAQGPRGLNSLYPSSRRRFGAAWLTSLDVACLPRDVFSVSGGCSPPVALMTGTPVTMSAATNRKGRTRPPKKAKTAKPGGCHLASVGS